MSKYVVNGDSGTISIKINSTTKNAGDKLNHSLALNEAEIKALLGRGAIKQVSDNAA